MAAQSFTEEYLERIANALEDQNDINRELIRLRNLEVEANLKASIANAEKLLLSYGRPDYPTQEQREAWQAEEKPFTVEQLDAYKKALEKL